MDLIELTPIIVPLLVFLASVVVVILVGGYVSQGRRVSRRLTAGRLSSQWRDHRADAGSSLRNIIARNFSEERLNLDKGFRARVRKELIRAGYFSDDAVSYYVFLRLLLVVALPVGVYTATFFLPRTLSQPIYLLLIVGAGGLGLFGVDAYVKRRQRSLRSYYQIMFPEVLDLLMVCVDAGLSVEAAFERVAEELGLQSRTLSLNLELMLREMRAGRSLVQGLDGLADQLDIDEIRSFVVLLRQSVELGTDVSDALRTYSDEMRDRRLMRAEERAQQLPVKMVIPLGVFIFPVILGMTMVPVIIRLVSVMK